MLNRRTFLFCLTVTAMATWTDLSARADAGDLASRASAFVNALGTEAVAVMSDKSITRAERVRHFHILFHKNFDVPTIARFVLGRYWNQTTPAQQQEYLTQFEELVIRTYAAHFDSYGGSNLRVISSRLEGEHDAFVMTEIIPAQGPPTSVEWRVRQRDSQLGIIDIVVAGVSMSVSERQEFSSVIQAKAGSIDAFLTALREKNEAIAAAAH